MGFKVRGYDKIKEDTKARNYSLFAIACEGRKREPEYFGPFDGINRIKVDIIRREDDECDNNSKESENSDRPSSPKKVLEKVKQYVDEVGLTMEDNDSLWCVIDVDRWPDEQIAELAEYCKSNKNFHIIISNPCFEIWLLYHKYKSLDNVQCEVSKDAKQALHRLQKGGYCYLDYLPLMKTAIKNAKSHDSNPDFKHYYPKVKETKVYQLAEALYNKMGANEFNDFISSLCKMRSKNK